MMGMIITVGIVAEDGIFRVHYVRQFSREGEPLREAVIRVGHIRIRPIIMTTLVAVLALLPLAVGLAVGSQMQQPLAIAVIGGLSFSAFLLLLLLPVFYALIFKGREAK